MGFLGKLFGGGKEHAPFEATSPGAAQLEKYRTVLDAFAHKIHDKLEVMPGAMSLYCWIGHPAGSLRHRLVHAGRPGEQLQE